MATSCFSFFWVELPESKVSLAEAGPLFLKYFTIFRNFSSNTDKLEESLRASVTAKFKVCAKHGICRNGVKSLIDDISPVISNYSNHLK